MQEPDDLQYRSPFQQELPGKAQESVQDEVDFSTLQVVRKVLANELEALNKDFNAFQVLNAEDPEAEAKKLVIQILAKKQVAEILTPLINLLDSSISTIESRYTK